MTSPNPPASMPVISREYVYSTVSAEGEDDPTTLPVYMAFMTVGPPDVEPGDADWVVGSWQPDTTNARCLVGPESDKPLAKGTWYVWLWIDGAVEAPKRYIGKLKVT